MPKGKKLIFMGSVKHIHRCNECEYQCNNRKCMQLREKKVHPDVFFFDKPNRLGCPKCGKNFNHKGEMQNHFKNTKCYAI